MSEYDLPVFLYGSTYMYLSIYYFEPKVTRNILSLVNCIHSIISSYLFVYENANTLGTIRYWCIAYYIYDSVLSIINTFNNRSIQDFGYLLHHIVTMFLLCNGDNKFCINSFFEFECTNLFLYFGFFLKKTNNKNLILCKLAHLIVYSYIRLYGGYYIVQHLYNYMEYELFIGGLFLYLLCWIGIFILLQETRDEIKKIYRKSQLDLCHQY